MLSIKALLLLNSLNFTSMKTYVVFLVAHKGNFKNQKTERHVLNADSPENAAKEARRKMRMKLRGETLNFFVNQEPVYL